MLKCASYAEWFLFQRAMSLKYFGGGKWGCSTGESHEVWLILLS